MEMDDRTRQSMSLVFKHRAGDGITLTDEAAADIAIFDLDTGVEKSLNTFRSLCAGKPGFRAVGLSSNSDVEHDGIVLLHKPISAGRLLEAIQQASGRQLQTTSIKTSAVASSLSARVTGSRRRPEATVVAEEKKHFDPNAYLLGTILNAEAEARQRDMVAVISFYGDRIICVDGKNKLIETNLSSSQARGFAISAVNVDEGEGWSATVGLDRPAIEYLSHAEVKRRFGGKTYAVPHEIFMWKLGAATSRGRLPEGLSMDERVYLRRWPNMTRFSYTDNEMRIVAYWLRQADSLREIAEALDVTEQEVSAVYTAAFAAGLAGKARRESDGIWEAPEVVEHKQRGVFSSILKKLLQRKPATAEEVVA